MTLKLLHRNPARLEFDHWSKWMESADLLAQRLADGYDDDPFYYNETASVSHLVAAAAAIDYRTLAEFSMMKRSEEGRVSGRWDFWMATEDRRNWGIEFKQISGDFTLPRLRGRMKLACSAADRLGTTRSTVCAGGVIATLRYLKGGAVAAARSRCEEYANEVDLCWSISSPRETMPTFLFFKFV